MPSSCVRWSKLSIHVTYWFYIYKAALEKKTTLIRVKKEIHVERIAELSRHGDRTLFYRQGAILKVLGPAPA